MNELFSHIYNQAWDSKNIRLSGESKKNLYSAGMILILGVLIAKQIEKQ